MCKNLNILKCYTFVQVLQMFVHWGCFGSNLTKMRLVFVLFIGQILVNVELIINSYDLIVVMRIFLWSSSEDSVW